MIADPFRQRTALLLVVFGTISLLTGLGFVIFGERPTAPSYQADSYSRSAIGHSAFVELLRALGIPVLTTRRTEHMDGSQAATGGDGPLQVFLEPPLDVFDDGSDTLARALASELTMLVALPKWRGLPDPAQPGHVAALRPLPEGDYDGLLRGLGVTGQIRRLEPDAPIAWRSAIGELVPALHRPQVIDGLGNPAGEVTPLLWCDAGVLVARLRWQSAADLVLVSDPDLFSNAGLSDGDNAELAVAIVEAHRRPDQVVAFDETTHGYTRDERNVWASLARFPLVLICVQALLLLAVVLWYAIPRFGPVREPTPSIGRGKEFLIASTAGLMRVGADHGRALGRYFDETVRAVASRLHAPAQLEGPPLLEWLAERGDARGVNHDPRALAERAAALEQRSTRDMRAVVSTARAIHAWRRAMLGRTGEDE